MGSTLEQQEDPARLMVLFLVRGWPQTFTETGNSPVLCLQLPWPCAVGQGTELHQHPYSTAASHCPVTELSQHTQESHASTPLSKTLFMLVPQLRRKLEGTAFKQDAGQIASACTTRFNSLELHRVTHRAAYRYHWEKL